MDPHTRARAAMVADLIEDRYVRTEAVARAFRAVPREAFVGPDLQGKAYLDAPLPIGMGQTISAPSMIAIMLEAADLAAGQRVLDVGTGSGYNAALLAAIVGAGNVVSIERHPELTDAARRNLAAAGFAGAAPYDRIVVTAGAPRIAPSWVRQTKVGGRIVAPIGRSTFSQTLVIATKTAEDRIEEREDTPCAFVPLIGKEGW